MDAPARLRHLRLPVPGQFGLRGDLCLWEELTLALADCPRPASPAAADALLASLYLRFVGETPQAGRQPFVARYNLGGLSSGLVSASFWLEKGFPLLKSRLLTLD